jgi:hypothetical protein
MNIPSHTIENISMSYQKLYYHILLLVMKHHQYCNLSNLGSETGSEKLVNIIDSYVSTFN